jgi:hypothetical protein
MDTTLILDSKKRITLGKLLQFEDTQSVQATVKKNGDILLKPMTSIPTRELWLYKNKKTFNSVQRGLSQKGTVDRGSFAKYAKK